MNLGKEDVITLNEKGITETQLQEQLSMLANGFPYLRIEAPATIGNGIKNPDNEVQKLCINMWDKYLQSDHMVVKMVPASGAASRMFKDLFAFLNSKHNKPDNNFVKTFFNSIEDFAFFPRLNHVAMEIYGKSVSSLIEDNKYKEIVELLLNNTGLGYGHLPKALLQFHKTEGGARTPFEEHMAEGASYVADKKKNVRIHFTVSPEHLALAQSMLEEVRSMLENTYGVKYDVTFSVQKPSTDTVAVNLDGTPYRENGKLFFRPGGHGALIENLNDLDADIVFLKNIDNVVPDHNRELTIHYKKVLGGIAVGAKIRLDEYCQQLSKGVPASEEMDKMIDFARKVLCITHDNFDSMTQEQKAEYLMGKFNRPLRVCGMVRNEGEPGGGPFLVYNPDGTVSPQILETTQIDPKDKKAAKMLKNATHFNPVDLVCAIRDYKGNKFDLPSHVDRATGFISTKSREGVEIKALELPGLWNGAMSDWNTIFVEVPIETFNPVKTVNDLLRPAHRD